MLSALVLLIATIIFTEVSTILFKKGLLVAQLLLALSVGVLHFLFSFFLDSPWEAQAQFENDITLFALNLWSAIAPILILSLLAFALSKINRAFLMHLTLVILCTAIFFSYPWFLLLSICASGLDCV